MSEAARPADEVQRLAALTALDVDSAPEAGFDALVETASLVRGEKRPRLDTVIEATQLGTWQWNIQTDAAIFNDWWARQIGYEHADIEHLTHSALLELMHPADRERVTAEMARHIGGETATFEAEFRLRHRDGHWVWLLDIGRVMSWTADGKPEWMFGTRKNIMQRKIHQEALRKSEEFLNRTGRIAGVGGWELDLRTNELFWSDETCRIHGVPPGYRPTLEEAIRFYAPEAQAAIAGAVERGIATGESWDLEVPFVSARGEHLWVHTGGSVIFEDGKAVRLTGAFQDVTQHVAAREALRKANDRVMIATDSGGIGIYEWDMHTGELLWDAWMYRLFGLDPTRTKPDIDCWRTMVHRDDLATVERAVQQSIESGFPLDTEYRIVWPDGSVRHLRSSGHATRDAAGRPMRFVGANWDVTEARRLAAELAEQHELVRVTLHSIADAVITTDCRGSVVWLNPVAERMTGWPMSDAVGRPVTAVFNIVDEQTREPAAQPVQACLVSGTTSASPATTVLLSRRGDEFGIEESAAPIRSAQGEILGAVLVFHDVTEQRRLSGEIHYRATHDALTGLVNRAELETRLGRLLTHSRTDDSLHALLYIDLDEFKLVNDACGHAAGDEVLQQVAKLLTHAVRAGDTLARLGGDEFAVILEHCSADQAQRAAQSICTRMDHFRYTRGTRQFRVGASIGLVPVDRRWEAVEAIYAAADGSCYAAKAAGRNRVHTWIDTDVALYGRYGATQWTARIEEAFDANRFVLFAQRIADLRSPRGPLRAEVLLRMTDRDESVVLPGAFLPAAERFHLASRIDRWVITRALEWLARVAPAAGLDSLSINLSGQSVADPMFHQWAIETFREAGPAVCALLRVDIAESAAVANLADAGSFIAALRRLHIGVALDGFGAGSSSFGCLKTLGVNALKIDEQFIFQLVDDPLCEVSVRCFRDLANVLGIETIAECVERPDVLERLRAFGIDSAQGFFIHRPAPIDELLEQHAPLELAR